MPGKNPIPRGAARLALLAFTATQAPALLAQGAPPRVALYSHNFRQTNSNPIHYQYQWCDSAGSCTDWQNRSLKPGGSAFASLVQCYNTSRRVKMKVRYDWKFAEGLQNKSYDLDPQGFEYRDGAVPSSGCITSGAFHFLSRDETLYLYSGPPKDAVRGACRWLASD